MHYMEASIREILRLETLTPNGVPRVALESTQLEQYDIPKVNYYLEFFWQDSYVEMNFQLELCNCHRNAIRTFRRNKME